MEISEFEKKRAANLIWNGAQDYSISAGFRVYDENGKADIYWNSIVGAIHRNYDWQKLMLFYETFQETVNQSLYESLFWIALENAVYEREKKRRPVFPYLRREYARRRLGEIYVVYDEGLNSNRAGAILKGHLRRSLGQDCGLPDEVDRKLLEDIELGPELATDQAVAAIEKVLRKYIGYRRPGEKEQKTGKTQIRLHPLIFLKNKRRRRGGQPMGPVRALAMGYGEHADEYGSEVLDQSHLSVAFAAYSAQTDEGLKEYITSFFGKSIYTDKTVLKMQKDYCQGNHTDVKLHFTRGEYTTDMLEKGYAGKMKKTAIEQEKKNTAAYEAKIGVYTLAVEKLTERIRNTLLMHMDDSVVKSPVGKLDARRVWRGTMLNDDRVFCKVLPGDTGNITVDLLLDSSTSQIRRQETVSAQGYMIAQALTNVGIPVRVYSFCSLNGYTIVNLFRDYGEVTQNRQIFRYFTTGANRDGLAVRLAAGWMKENHADHRILIILSDCKPNDVVKVRTGSGSYKNYAAETGVQDTAAEVHAARMQGITVMCVFTGEDGSVANAHQMYGNSFVRIRSLDKFADAVGTMLQNEIRRL